MRKTARAIRKMLLMVSRRESRMRRLVKRARNFEAYQVANMVRLNGKLVLMGK